MPKIIAEIGASHAGSFENAIKLIDAAAEAGADAVKFQCFSADQMAIPGYTIKEGQWKGMDLLDLYHEIETPKEWFPVLFDYAKKKSLVAFSSVFHADDVDFMESLDCPMYKIASFEITDLELISRVALTGQNVIISTGCADREHIKAAAKLVPENQLTLLHCVSEYPANLDQVNLATMKALYKYAGNVGLSDHSHGSVSAIAATALGATMIEKHIKLDGIGQDSSFALNFKAFSSLVRDVRDTSKALGKVKFRGLNELSRSCHNGKMKRPNINYAGP